MERNRTRENLVYLGIWILLFLTPIISMLVRMSSDSQLTFNWKEIIMSWRVFIPYLAVFLLHNYLVAPILVHKKKNLTYAAITICILTAAQLYECSRRPDLGHKPAPFEMKKGGHGFGKHDGHMPPPPNMHSRRDGQPPSFGPGHDRPPFILGQRDIITLIVMVLMIGMNLGVKYYFKSRQDAKKMEELEKKTLQQQLEYLKYQINPHFFMNTLNNIHALVDIEPEEAKRSILELSKMMRYVLYEGAKSKVPLQKEIGFLNNYITLMKLRYTDKVRIDIKFPEKLANKMVPPMLLITYVENAFKHGVSYQKESFIESSITTDDSMLHFTCLNSIAPKEKESQGGVGLANTRQRLHLIYGENFTLDIKDNGDTYSVKLDIPFLPSD